MRGQVWSWCCVGGLVLVVSLGSSAGCSVEDDDGFEFGDDGSSGSAGAPDGSAGQTGATGGGGSAGSANTSGGAPVGGEATAGAGGEAESPPEDGAANGAACDDDLGCASNHCVDDICCDSACDGACRSCSEADTGVAAGRCAPVTRGTDPQSDCAEDSDACGLTGSCDGAGACEYAGPDAECAPSTCGGGEFVPASKCDGSGACETPEALPCDTCDGDVCDIACDVTDDCPGGFFCDGASCLPARVPGASCAGGEECASNHCARGVCCDEACSGTCRSCLRDDTGEADGTCADVEAGTEHDDCDAEPSSSCGFDGTCDGAGACRLHQEGTVCAPASCPAGASTRTLARTCNGDGACSSPETSSCGDFACDSQAGTCLSSCAGDADCVDSVCLDTQCVEEKEAGEVCASDAECASGDCGGRCCESGSPCTCTQPNSGNLIENPGFDRDLSGWTADSGSADVDHADGGDDDDNDFEGCPFSGSARLSGTASAQQRFAQCVNLDTQVATYNIGYSVKGERAFCAIERYTQTDCAGTATTTTPPAWDPGDVWEDWTLSMGRQSYRSVRVACWLEPLNSGEFWLDNVYVSPAPARF